MPFASRRPPGSGAFQAGPPFVSLSGGPGPRRGLRHTAVGIVPELALTVGPQTHLSPFSSLLCTAGGSTPQGAFPRLACQLPSAAFSPRGVGKGRSQDISPSLSASRLGRRGAVSSSRCISSSAPVPSGWPLPLRSQLLQRKFTVVLALRRAVSALDCSRLPLEPQEWE